MTRTLGLAAILIWLLVACTLSSSEPKVVYVTATPGGQVAVPPTPVPRVDLSPVPDSLTFFPTPNPGHTGRPAAVQSHVVQSGDTLLGIALAYGTTLDTILEINEMENPDSLYIGQIISLPELPTEYTPGFKIMPDSRLVRGPGSSAFDIAAFISRQPGYIRTATDLVTTRLADGNGKIELLNAAQIVERVSLQFSVDPRLLLALLEYRAGWLSNPAPASELRTHPLISKENSGEVDREGLYRQLSWAADQLNAGYYGWKYEDLRVVSFPGETRLLFASGLNPASVALQRFLSFNTSHFTWQRDISKDGFFRLYWGYFGDPFQEVDDPLVPPGLQQPPFVLPFGSGETWYYTGGWHGGWGNGSAWAAIDLAPPDDPSDTGNIACYTSKYPVQAVAPGVIARSEDGVVMLDLDGDMDEATGWTVLYLHIASEGRIAEGTQVQAGDALGYTSCEGGFSTATHLHIARRYNGEWIPADCQFCPPEASPPAFVMDGWAVVGLEDQVYQGFLQSASGAMRVATQGRQNTDNQLSK